MTWRYEIIVSCWLLLVGQSEGARILGVCPFPSYSHSQPFHGLMTLLSERGHNVTVITPFPLKNPPRNYVTVDLSEAVPQYKRSFKYAEYETTILGMFESVMTTTGQMCDAHFNSTAMRKFMKEEHEFDLVIMQIFLLECYFGLIPRLGSPPTIGYLSMGSLSAVLDAVGNPVFSAVSPDYLTLSTDHMSLWDRMYNWAHIQMSHRLWNNHLFPIQEQALSRWFGPDVPSVKEMIANVSALFVTNFWGTDYPRLMLPHVVELSGLNIPDKIEPLPQDLQEFFDSAEEGVIYMSLGSNVRSCDLPADTVSALLDAFSRLPQKVLWKWEEGSPMASNTNVLFRKWLPQNPVLAHPKTRLFITQGGLQSLHEAAFFGVPMLVVPFVADQHHNALKVASMGGGRVMRIREMQTDSLYEVLTDLTTNKTYSDNMKNLQSLFRDHRMKSKHDAVWWVEFLIKNRGAPQLRPPTLRLQWYQLLMLDAFAVAIGVSLLTVALLYWTLRYLVKIIKRSLEIKEKQT